MSDIVPPSERKTPAKGRDSVLNRRRSKAMQIVWGDEPIIDLGGGISQVPSQSGAGMRTCNLHRGTCDCEYFRKTRQPCKHLEAARIQKARAALEHGDEIVSLDSLPSLYRQPVWYDRAKAAEDRCLRQLLRCLGLSIPLPPSIGRGRPRAPLGDLLVAGTYAAYKNRPSRKAIDDALVREGLVLCPGAIAPVTLRSMMRSEEFTAVIRHAIRKVAMCTRRLDTEFAIDSTFFKTPLSQIHIERRGRGETATTKILVAKAHLAAGLRSLMVYGVRVADGNESDQRGFIPTLQQFADYVRVDRILADAGYCDAAHYEYVASLGGEAFIDFKVGLKAQGFPHYDAQLALWTEYRDIWLDVYRFRTLIECVNSMIKRSIKRVIRARLEQSRENEILLAVLAYNLGRLVIARLEHGVTIPWADASTLAMIDGVLDSRAA